MKIPEKAKCVFEGVIFSVWQWQQKMFDGSYQTFERIKRPDTVIIIPVEDKNILAVDEEQPDIKRGLGLFCGRIEDGESELDAAKRELKEESGYESEDWELLKKYSPLSKMDWDIYVYIARDCRKTAEPVPDPGEKLETKKISFDEFIDLLKSENFFSTGLQCDIFKMENSGIGFDDLKKKLFGK